MIKKRLFTPGPVTMYPPSLAAALDANIHHRTPEFRQVIREVMDSLARLFSSGERTFLFASSGTGAMEAAVTNFFSPEDEVLVASCGKFGERWIDLVSRFGLKAQVLKYPYGEEVRVEDIDSALRERPSIRGVFLQACESSTGVQNSVSEIATVVARTEALYVVDAISAIATMPLSVSSGIDVIVSGSQKALMIPPGLAFMGVSERAWRAAEQSRSARYYFDLRSWRKAWDQNAQTPFTPATTLVMALQKSLQAIEQWGMSRLIQLTENRARAMRAAIQAIGLEPFARTAPANALTAVRVADNGAEEVAAGLKTRFGIHVAGGQGELKGEIFRVSHMGFIDHFDLLGILSALEFVLQKQGRNIELGASLREFQRIYSEVA